MHIVAVVVLRRVESRWGSGEVGGVFQLLPSRRLGVRRLLGGPELLVLLAAEALVVVAFALEELLEVRLAVELPLQGRKAAQAEEREGGSGG